MALNLNSFKSATLLYVEDDEFIRKQTSSIFKELFAHVLICEDGAKALEVYKKEKNIIDIIATDIEMPHMNGIELATKIREINDTVPIIVTSAYNDEEYYKKSIDLGIGQYLKKPVKFKELSTAIETLLEKSSHQKLLKSTNQFLTKKTKEFVTQHQQTISKLKIASNLYKNQEMIINKYVLRVECNLKAEIQNCTDRFLSAFQVKINDIQDKNIGEITQNSANNNIFQKSILECAKTKKVQNFTLACTIPNHTFEIDIAPIFSDDIVSGYYVYLDPIFEM